MTCVPRLQIDTGIEKIELLKSIEFFPRELELRSK